MRRESAQTEAKRCARTVSAPPGLCTAPFISLADIPPTGLGKSAGPCDVCSPPSPRRVAHAPQVRRRRPRLLQAPGVPLAKEGCLGPEHSELFVLVGLDHSCVAVRLGPHLPGLLRCQRHSPVDLAAWLRLRNLLLRRLLGPGLCGVGPSGGPGKACAIFVGAPLSLSPDARLASSHCAAGPRDS